MRGTTCGTFNQINSFFFSTPDRESGDSTCFTGKTTCFPLIKCVDILLPLQDMDPFSFLDYSWITRLKKKKEEKKVDYRTDWDSLRGTFLQWGTTFCVRKKKEKKRGKKHDCKLCPHFCLSGTRSCSVMHCWAPKLRLGKRDWEFGKSGCIRISINSPQYPHKSAAGMLLLFPTEIKPEKPFLSLLKRLHNFKERIWNKSNYRAVNQGAN